MKHFLAALVLTVLSLAGASSIALADTNPDCLASCQSTCPEGTTCDCETECAVSAPPLTAPGPSAPATSGGASVPRTLQNPLGTSDLRLIIGNIVKSLLSLSGAAGLLMFVWGGFQFLTAGGDPKKVEKGKATLVWATIGLVVIFSAYTLLDTLIKALSGSIF